MSEQQAEYITDAMVMTGKGYPFPEWKILTVKVWHKTEGKCWYCGTDTQPYNREKFLVPAEGYGRPRVRIPPDTFVVDHVVPLSLSGKSDIDNLVPCCWDCNGAKKNKSVEEFRFFRMRQLAGMPRFNDDQLAYLCAHGISLPAIPEYIFYFEQQELQP